MCWKFPTQRLDSGPPKTSKKRRCIAHTAVPLFYVWNESEIRAESADRGTFPVAPAFETTCRNPSGALISLQDISIRLRWCLLSLQWLGSGWRCCVYRPGSHMKGNNPERLGGTSRGEELSRSVVRHIVLYEEITSNCEIFFTVWDGFWLTTARRKKERLCKIREKERNMRWLRKGKTRK